MFWGSKLNRNEHRDTLLTKLCRQPQRLWGATLKNALYRFFHFTHLGTSPAGEHWCEARRLLWNHTRTTCRISITVSGEQLPFGQSILQIGCQQVKSNGNSSSQTRTHPLSGKEGGVWEMAGLQTEMSGCNPECWMLNELGRKGESRVMNGRTHLGEGHRKNSLGNAAEVFFFPPNPSFFIAYSLNKSSPCKDKGLKLKGLTHISSSQYQISPVIFTILIP